MKSKLFGSEGTKSNLKGKIQMKNIGKYNGIPCYECSHKEYIAARNGKLDDGRSIFIIDGTMVKNNIIVGYYNGKSVEDVYDMKTYLRSDEAKTAQARPTTVAEATGTEVKEIVYSNYSTVVDDFFANLEDPVVECN